MYESYKIYIKLNILTQSQIHRKIDEQVEPELILCQKHFTTNLENVDVRTFDAQTIC